MDVQQQLNLTALLGTLGKAGKAVAEHKQHCNCKYSPKDSPAPDSPIAVPR